MTDHFQQSPDRSRGYEGSPIKISGLSPERYGSTAYKNLSYTPEKLQNNFIYREVTVTKKIENQKNRIRELESLNSLLEEKIKHLSHQNQTIKQSLELQVEMYKKMLREQEDKAKSVIQSLQSQYTLEIRKILSDHEQDSKVAQAQKEELERRIEQLLAKIDELQGHLHHRTNTINDLTGNLNLTSQKLINTEDKMSRAEDVARQAIERLGKQLDSLNNRLHLQNSNFKQQLDAFNTDKIREIQALKRLHLTELDKLQNKRDAQMNAKNLDMKDIKNTFQVEARRLEDIIHNKDRVIEGLSNELKKQKQMTIALTRNYDLEINRLVNEKDHILGDLTLVNDQKNSLKKELEELILLFEAERGRSAVVVNSLQGEIGKKNIQLASENQRLLRTVNQYEKELAIASHNISSVHKTLDLQRTEQNRRLLLQIRNLKQILLQSSREMQKCKEEFLRMQIERQKLIRINHECQSQAMRMKAIINQQQIQLRIRRI